MHVAYGGFPPFVHWSLWIDDHGSWFKFASGWALTRKRAKTMARYVAEQYEATKYY